jgi:hypothetical protein
MQLYNDYDAAHFKILNQIETSFNILKASGLGAKMGVPNTGQFSRRPAQKASRGHAVFGPPTPPGAHHGRGRHLKPRKNAQVESAGNPESALTLHQTHIPAYAPSSPASPVTRNPKRRRPL